jgi:hypothetical protein
MGTCATCKHRIYDPDSFSRISCNIELPQNLIAGLASLVESDGLRNERIGDYWRYDFPPAPVAADHSCAFHEEEDFDPIDTGDVV